MSNSKPRFRLGWFVSFPIGFHPARLSIITASFAKERRIRLVSTDHLAFDCYYVVAVCSWPSCNQRSLGQINSRETRVMRRRCQLWSSWILLRPSKLPGVSSKITRSSSIGDRSKREPIIFVHTRRPKQLWPCRTHHVRSSVAQRQRLFPSDWRVSQPVVVRSAVPCLLQPFANQVHYSLVSGRMCPWNVRQFRDETLVTSPLTSCHARRESFAPNCNVFSVSRGCSSVNFWKHRFFLFFFLHIFKGHGFENKSL